MTYQMIQSVAVTGDIYQQFISYLLHESDTILLGTQNRERWLDGVPVSPTLIKQYEELQMFTILDVKWCQVEPDYLYDKADKVSGLQQLIDLLQVECLAFVKQDEILFIEYIGDSNWRLVPDSDLIESVMEKVALSPDYYKEEVAKLPRKISLLPVYEEVNPSPEVGMRVQYDNWGEKEAIYVLRDGEYKEVEMLMTQVSSRLQFSETFAYNPLPRGKRKPVGTYTYGKVVPETTKKAGYKKNKIVIKKNTVTGTGDFTVYTGGKTEEGKTLKKGDCATKGEIDNPNTGKKIKVTNKMNGTTATFYKRDNGKLYNAVIDIWKTGVEKLGVKSKKYDDIKKAAKYTYTY